VRLARAVGCLGLLWYMQAAAGAAITFTFEQVGANVRATVSGTITADFGSKTAFTGGISGGGLNDAFGGFGFGRARLAYGNSAGYDLYQLSGTSLLSSSPVSAPSGGQVAGGVVQSGYNPTFFSANLWFGSSPQLNFSISPNVTSLNTQILWTGQSLSNFFTTPSFGQSYQLRKASDSSVTLVTLNIVPEPSALSLLLAGLASLGLIHFSFASKSGGKTP